MFELKSKKEAIYRGDGGSGDATSNVTITEIQNLRSEAQLAAAEAENAQNYSEEWANKAEDSLVSTAAGGDGVDDYSSMHWSFKSGASATAAALSETNAATSATNAANSATSASTSASNAATYESNAAASAAEAATYVADQTGNAGKFLQTNGSTVSWQTALVPSDIGVSVQAYDATILNDADIGVTVQGYDVNTAKYDAATANFTGTLQNGGSNVVVDTDVGVAVQAYDVDTAKTDIAQTFTAAQRGEVTTLTSTANSIAINLAASNNFSHTLTQNTTLAAPTNAVEGQSGAITIIQNATTARTLAYNTFWKFEGGTVPAISTTLGSRSTFVYYVDNGGATATCNLIGPVS